MVIVKKFYKEFFGMLILIAMLFSFGRADAAYDAETEKLLGIINTYRVGNGRVPLSGDTLLQNSANWMSEDMVSNCIPNSFSCSHTDSLRRTVYQRLQIFGYPAGSTNDTLRASEIIVWGMSGFSTAEKAFGWWQKSPVHNDNILRDYYRAVGISRTCKGSYCAWVVDFGGKVMQDFIFSSTPTSTPPATPIISPTPAVATVSILSTPVPTLAPVLASPLPAILTDIQNFPEGSLIREIGGADVYIVKYMGVKKFKRLILSPSVFTNYGHLKWSDVKDTDQSVLDSFQTSDLVRAVGDPKVYKLNASGDTGEKRWIPTAEIFIQAGFDWDAIYEINAYDRDSYVSGVNWE